jgi:pyruvate,orthophosphate dikinase
MSRRGITPYRIPFDGAADELPGKEIVGSKGHNLMRMARRGLPVPHGFVLPTELCRRYLKLGKAGLDGLELALERELEVLAQRTGRMFGDPRRPLLVSVRSGAAVSMPGMMETVLNIGLTPLTRRGLIRSTGNPRLAEDCRRRLVQQYGEVVLGIPPARFNERLREFCAGREPPDVDLLDTNELAALAASFEEVFTAESGHPFPQDPMRQLSSAVEAVLRSWSSERAKSYRKLNGIPDDMGTAVTIQAMAYGNLGPTSGSGVGFTRNPANGRNELYVDYLPNAQGEDVVSGRRRAYGIEALERRTPEAYRALTDARSVLELEFGDMQDFEFTVEAGTLLLLQSRTGKRTPLAALRIAYDLVSEQIISPAEAAARIEGLDLETVRDERLAPEPGVMPLSRGIGASSGVAIGVAAFDPSRVVALREAGRPVVLFRPTAETADVAALAEAAALVTAEGARTSHAAVVARELGKPCIVACTPLELHASGRSARFGPELVAEGATVAIDGASGEVYSGEQRIVCEQAEELLAAARSWRRQRGSQRPPRKEKEMPKDKERSHTGRALGGTKIS